MWAGDVAQWLRTLPALLEEQIWFLAPASDSSQPPATLALGVGRGGQGSDVFFGTPRASAVKHVCAHTLTSEDTHTHPYTHKATECCDQERQTKLKPSACLQPRLVDFILLTCKRNPPSKSPWLCCLGPHGAVPSLAPSSSVLVAFSVPAHGFVLSLPQCGPFLRKHLPFCLFTLQCSRHSSDTHVIQQLFCPSPVGTIHPSGQEAAAFLQTLQLIASISWPFC